MTTAKVTFHGCHQDSQKFGSNDDHMVSRIFFDLEIEGKEFSNLSVDIKQTVGSNFKNAPLEVSSPHDYKGPFNHDAFRKEAELYYRESFGPKGSAIRWENVEDLRMQDNIVARDKVVEFEVKGGPSGW